MTANKSIIELIEFKIGENKNDLIKTRKRTEKALKAIHTEILNAQKMLASAYSEDEEEEEEEWEEEEAPRRSRRPRDDDYGIDL